MYIDAMPVSGLAVVSATNPEGSFSVELSAPMFAVSGPRLHSRPFCKLIMETGPGVGNTHIPFWGSDHEWALVRQLEPVPIRFAEEQGVWMQDAGAHPVRSKC